jgi:hypothetical protein
MVGAVEAASAVPPFDDQVGSLEDSKMLGSGGSGDLADPDGDLGRLQLLGPDDPENMAAPGSNAAVPAAHPYSRPRSPSPQPIPTAVPADRPRSRSTAARAVEADPVLATWTRYVARSVPIVG